MQCGFCTPGMLMAAKALLDRAPDPTDAQIIDALEGNLCRCTGYVKIIDAVRLAAARMRGDLTPVEGSRLKVESEPSTFNLQPSRDHPVIGGSMLRTDSIPKVTGAALYVEDMALPDTLHGGVLRSPHHHARLISLNITPATIIPGVVAVLTADDITGENGLGDYSQEEPVLCPVGGTVRMVGAPVALVVAETPAAAKAGLAAIVAGYEILPHVFETDEALSPGATHIAGRGDNVLTSFAVQHGDLEAAFAASATIVEAEYRTAFLEHSALERETLLGYYDEEGRLTVTGGNHEPFYQQKYIANALALPLDRVRVIMPPTGGSFGGKQDPWPFIATALMTQAVRRPVKLVYSRTESFDATPKRHPYVVRSKIGATADGRLTGIRVRIDANTGGYDAGGQYIPNYAVTASGGPYHWQAVDAYAQTVYTNGPKAGQYRGFGTAQSAFAAECALDELAEKLGIDPLEFRLKNTLRTGRDLVPGLSRSRNHRLHPGARSPPPALPSLPGRCRCVQQVPLSTCFLVYQFTNYQFTNPQSTVRRGVGLAGMWYRFGKSGTLRVEAHAELARDGRFIIYCTAADYGQGMNTVVSQMAAEALGVPRARIEVVNGDTARSLTARSRAHRGPPISSAGP